MQYAIPVAESRGSAQERCQELVATKGFDVDVYSQLLNKKRDVSLFVCWCFLMQSHQDDMITGLAHPLPRSVVSVAFPSFEQDTAFEQQAYEEVVNDLTFFTEGNACFDSIKDRSDKRWPVFHYISRACEYGVPVAQASYKYSNDGEDQTHCLPAKVLTCAQ